MRSGLSRGGSNNATPTSMSMSIPSHSHTCCTIQLSIENPIGNANLLRGCNCVVEDRYEHAHFMHASKLQTSTTLPISMPQPMSGYGDGHTSTVECLAG